MGNQKQHQLNPTQLLQKLIRIRKFLVRKGFSQKPSLATVKAITYFENWLNAYPKHQPEGIIKMVRTNAGHLFSLLPGCESKNYNTLRQQVAETFGL